MADETAVESHFAFGENWTNFTAQITDAHVDEAVNGLRRLIDTRDIDGARFLDAGCGSGLSSLAALKLGAHIQAIDLDPKSVAATQALLQNRAPDNIWSCETRSILDLPSAWRDSFDIVYSWGVLHHTGDMWTALDNCAARVRPGGLLVLALYRRTPFCRTWRTIKRTYTRGGPYTRALIRSGYKTAFALGLMMTGRSPRRYAETYASNRGMSWATDIEDWLGGYPYASVTPNEVASHLEASGFTLERSFTKPASLKGLLGTHCDEFVYRKHGPRSVASAP